ncbi:MAG: hypothetical protein R3321_10490, partial [Nitrososphaeraceae archaeon]|nr:hypothetical protein [Nitrososphaeraceae archaeon]
MKSLSFCFSTAFAEFHNPTNYKFVTKWGGAGEDNRQFLRPHDLDFSQDEQKLYAIDRDENRLQAFSTFLESWDEIDDIPNNLQILNEARKRVEGHQKYIQSVISSIQINESVQTVLNSQSGVNLQE